MMELSYSVLRYEALKAVQDGKVVYHNGLTGENAGYQWKPRQRQRMAPAVQTVLNDLWLHGCIDIQTGKIFAPEGYSVVITRPGRECLEFWAHCRIAEMAA